MTLKIPRDLIHASFFFIDIVGLSNPATSTDTQTTKIKILNQSIKQCDTFKSTQENEFLFLPTGDGMVIGFLNGLEKPLNLAIELHQKLNEYNKEKGPTDKIAVRIGCHTGSVFIVNDIFGNSNYWGPGIILARRVMDLGDSGHILMTSIMAESLLELSEDYKKIIHPIHDYKIKHGQTLLLYSVHGQNFGNPSRPSRGLTGEATAIKEISEFRKTISFENVKYDLLLKDPTTGLVRHRRIYHLINNSKEPIYEIPNGIITSVEKTFFELDVRAFDEHHEELKIGGIHVDAPYRKEFTIKLNTPLFRGDRERKFSIEYLAEEPMHYFENLFLINTSSLSVQFEYPSNEESINPQLYLIKNQNREKMILQKIPAIKTGIYTTIKWKKTDGIFEKDLIRLEW